MVKSSLWWWLLSSSLLSSSVFVNLQQLLIVTGVFIHLSVIDRYGSNVGGARPLWRLDRLRSGGQERIGEGVAEAVGL